MTTEARHCPRCGGPLAERPPTACGSCGYRLYVNARPTASLVIVDGPNFLALKRKAEPRAGYWETPGGFCDGWEHPADAAVREAREELGLAVTLGPLVGLYVGDYVFQDERLPVLDCFYLARLGAGEIVLDPVESAAFAWFPLLSPPELAFDTMNRAIRDACDVWRRQWPGNTRPSRCEGAPPPWHSPGKSG